MILFLSVLFHWCIATVQRVVEWIALRLFCLSLVGSVAYATGFLHRLLCIFAEWHLSILLNNTQVTVGSITQTDFIRGVFAATNVVIHAPPDPPQQQQATSTTPSSVKKGSTGTTNHTPSTSTAWQSPIVARMGSVYVEVNAWQWLTCFLLHGGDDSTPLDFYTVHLRDVQVFVERRHGGGLYNVLLLDPHLVVPTTTSSSSSTTAETTPPASTTSTTTSPADTARVVLDDLLDAVGRAARDGTPDTLVTHYRHRLADQLSRTQNWRTALEESVALAQALPSSLAARTNVVLERRRAPVVYGRVGVVRMEELRIFVPTSTTASTEPKQQQQQLLPLYVPSFVLKPMELASTSSVHVFSVLDDVWDVILKRLLAELATTNTGRFFQTAMHEMAEALRDDSTTTTSQKNGA